VARLHMARIADVDIEPAVVVDVHEHGAGAPHAVLCEAGMGGNVFEMKVAFIEIELIVTHIGCKEDVGEAIVIEIANGNAAAVVEIPKEEAVLQFLILHFIVKVDARVIHQLEESGILLVVAAGTKDDTEKEERELEDFHVLNDRQVVRKKTKAIVKWPLQFIDS